MADDLVVSGIHLDARDTLREIRRLDRQMRRLEGQVDEVTTSTRKSERGFRSMGRAVAGAAAAFGAFRAAERTARFIFRTNVEFQKLEATLKTVTGSVENAEAAFDLITEFAKTTPFQVTELVSAFTQLRVRGVEPTTERLKGLGNFAAAFTEDIGRLTDAIVSGAAGMSRPLKRAFGLDIQKDANQLKVEFEDIERTIPATVEALSAFLAEIGNTRFVDAMSERMETLDGKISNLEDVAALAAKSVGEEGLNEAIQDLVGTLEEAIADNEEFARVLGENLASGVRVSTRAIEMFLDHTDALSRAMKTLATVVILRSLIPSLKSAAFFFRAAAGGAVFLSDVLVPLKAGMAALGGPAGVFLAAAGALHVLTNDFDEAIPSVQRLRKETDELRDAMEEMTRAEIENRIASIMDTIEQKRQEMTRLRQEVQETAGEDVGGGRLGLGAAQAGEIAGFKGEINTLDREVAALVERLGVLQQGLTDTADASDDSADAASRKAEAIEELIAELEQERDELRFSREELVARRLAELGASEATIAQARAIVEKIQALEDEKEAQEEARKAEEKRIEDALQHMEDVREANRQIREEARQRGREFQSQLQLAEIQAEVRRAERAAEGISKALTDPLIDVVTQTENVADAFESMVDSILRQMARIAVQETIGQALTSLLRGAFVQVPDAPPPIPAPAPPTFQHGGSFEVGGAGGPDSQLVQFRASPGEQVTVRNRHQQGRGGPTEVHHHNTNLNLSALDAKGVRRLLLQESGTVVRIVREAGRKGAFD